MITAHANGRVNLIGEHTDYNGGFVLPTGIPQQTIVTLKARGDMKVTLASMNAGGEPFTYELGQETPHKAWTDYVQGATKIMRELVESREIRGFDLTVSSDVPMGSGLSSSAALLVAVFKALREAWGLSGKLGDVEIAKLSQRVENEFVGAKVGIMDPMAASLASEGQALFIDTESLAIEQVRIPSDKMEIAVINSGIFHSNAHGGYNQRRRECEEACEKLGVKSLREVGLDRMAEIEQLPEPLGRRAKHVVTENQRVLDAVEALKKGDCEKLGMLFRQSHESMRDDYEVSVPDVDTLVAIANSENDVFGARLTGGGFGGSIVIGARAGKALEVARRVADLYAKQTNREPQILVPRRPTPSEVRSEERINENAGERPAEM